MFFVVQVVLGLTLQGTLKYIQISLVPNNLF